MAEAFGHKWTSAYGEAPLDTWAVALAGVTRAELGRGVERVLRMGTEWPPSAPTFRLMCTDAGIDTTDGAAVAARLPESRRLPETEQRKARRRLLWWRYRAEWDAILGGALSKRRREIPTSSEKQDAEP